MERIRRRFLFSLVLSQILAFVALFGTSAHVHARTQIDCAIPVSEQEFKAYAVALANKVDIFTAVWSKDPDAEIYGGTVRDYLFWIRSHLCGFSKVEAEQNMQRHLGKPFIKAREFLYKDSDIDLASDKGIYLEAEQFGLKKIDSKKKSLFDPKSKEGQDERKQGYLAVEKLRLSKTGFVESEGLGGGVSEIYNDQFYLRLASSSDFATTVRAKNHTNHPVLLVLRYIRLLALNYYRKHGSGYPDLELLIKQIDPASEQLARKVVAEVKRGGIKRHMQEGIFAHRLNSTIEKMFRAYTNPTAAKKLMEHFGLNDLPNYYSKVIPMNQFLFAQSWDEGERLKAIRSFSVNENRFYLAVTKQFPDGFCYHGTRTDATFRNIIVEGVLPSEQGLSGQGLYNVSSANLQIAENFGGTKENLIRFLVKPNARIVDISHGEGLRVWKLYSSIHGGDYEDFSKLFGIDIIRYDYSGAHAFVTKNSAVLGHAEGVNRPVLPLGELLERVQNIKDPAELLIICELNGLTKDEFNQVLEQSGVSLSDMYNSLRNPEVLSRIARMKSERLLLRTFDIMKTIGEKFSAEQLQVMFDSIVDLDSRQSMRLGINILNEPNAAVDPQKFLKFMKNPNAIDSIGRLLIETSGYVVGSSDDQLKFEVFKIAVEQGRLSDSDLLIKYFKLKITSADVRKQLSDFLFDYVRDNKFIHTNSVIRRILSEDYRELYSRISTSLRSENKEDQKLAVKLVSSGVMSIENMDAILDWLLKNPHSSLESIRILIELRYSEYEVNEAQLQKFWLLARSSSSRIRTLAFEFLNKMGPKLKGSDEIYEHLFARITSIPIVANLHALRRWRPTLPNSMEENSAALEVLRQLQNNGEETAEALLVSLLGTRIIGHRLRGFYFLLQHLTSVPKLKEILQHPLYASNAREFIQYQLKRELKPEIRQALEALVKMPVRFCERVLSRVTR